MTALREQRRFDASVARPRAGCAFTLVELLIAISILGVGITMAAALFPTAIKQNERSANDTIGMIVAKNALGIVKAKLTVADPNAVAIDENFQDIGTGGLQLVTEAELTYPVPREPRLNFPNDWDGAQLRPLALRGAVVLGRRFAPGRNDFQLVIVSFAKQARENTIEAVPVSSGNTMIDQQTEWSELRITGTPDERAAVQRGGVVIFDYNPDPAYAKFAGMFARIRATRTGGLAVLDRRFEDDDVDGDVDDMDELGIWLIVERDAITDAVVGGWSPVTSVLVTRTALRDQ